MTVFMLGKLGVQSRTQGGDWSKAEAEILSLYDGQEERDGLPQLVVGDGDGGSLLQQALTMALADLRKERADGEAMLQRWVMVLAAATINREQVWGMVKAFLMTDYVAALDKVAAARVTVLSGEVPIKWRLALSWAPELRIRPDLEWESDFKACYVNRMTKGLVFEP